MAFPREYTQREQTNVDVCVSRQGQTKNVVWMKNLNQSVLIIGIRLMTFWGTVQGTREGSRNLFKVTLRDILDYSESSI